MKIKTSFLVLLLGLFALSFTAVDTTYQVDAKQSKLGWLGRKIGGEHSGGLNLSKGTLQWDGKQLKGGSFEIDMTSITNTDITDKGYSQKLVDHLKSDDFFSTSKHPKATFVITKVSPAANNQQLVKGKLTIKGITHEVEFPAVVQTKGNQLTATAKIIVDRSLYDVRYGSQSFFADLGDKAIDNEFELQVALVATKAVAN